MFNQPELFTHGLETDDLSNKEGLNEKDLSEKAESEDKEEIFGVSFSLTKCGYGVALPLEFNGLRFKPVKKGKTLFLTIVEGEQATKKTRRAYKATRSNTRSPTTRVALPKKIFNDRMRNRIGVYTGYSKPTVAIRKGGVLEIKLPKLDYKKIVKKETEKPETTPNAKSPQQLEGLKNKASVNGSGQHIDKPVDKLEPARNSFHKDKQKVEKALGIVEAFCHKYGMSIHSASKGSLEITLAIKPKQKTVQDLHMAQESTDDERRAARELN